MYYAARLVVRYARRENITPVLTKKHWLPLEQRITDTMLLHMNGWEAEWSNQQNIVYMAGMGC